LDDIYLLVYTLQHAANPLLHRNMLLKANRNYYMLYSPDFQVAVIMTPWINDFVFRTTEWTRWKGNPTPKKQFERHTEQQDNISWCSMRHFVKHWIKRCIYALCPKV